MDPSQSEVHDTMAAINQSWREGQPSGMSRYLHPGITMVLPGFAGTVVGRDALLASFVEFCAHAQVLEYHENEEQIQITGNMAVVSFRFEMLYDRTDYRARSTGRDLWVFERSGSAWLAVWRTMIELKEERESIT